eukprot:tig00000128_g7217.t1
MAKKTEDGGWPSEFFEEGEEEKAEKLELVCPICLKVMREPTAIRCTNEHALCRSCALLLVRETGDGRGHPCNWRDVDESKCTKRRLKCPLDREFIDRNRFGPAAYHSRRINELKVQYVHVAARSLFSLSICRRTRKVAPLFSIPARTPNMVAASQYLGLASTCTLKPANACRISSSA